MKNWCIISYVDSLSGGFAGKANGPFIRILKKYKGDAGLLNHEKCHVEQWWRTFGCHGFLYKFSEKYRLNAEVEAYKEQMKITPQFIRNYAEFIATRYDLDVTAEEAEKLLTKGD